MLETTELTCNEESLSLPHPAPGPITIYSTIIYTNARAQELRVAVASGTQR